MTLTTQAIQKKLFDLADEKYKEFHSGLVPGCDGIIGIRMPALRKLAKELLKETQVEELLKIIGEKYYEEIMLRGLVIGMQPKPQWEVVRKQIEEFIPYIDNWAVCDIFCSSLKIIKKNKYDAFLMVQKYIKSEKEFERRWAVVILLDYYIEDEYISEVLKMLDAINLDGYYVKMAVAWAISVCLVKAYEQTINYLKISNLDDFTYNKSIQKARESYRITQEQKDFLKQIKR